MATEQEATRRESIDVATLINAFFQALIDKDMEAWYDLWADDALNEFPFAPPNYPKRLEGKAAIREYMNDFPKNIDVISVPFLKIHQTVDVNVVVMESRIEGRAVATKNPYNMSYICVIEFEDGKIARYVDYWNPLEVASALGGMDAFRDAFNAKALQ
jgi:ketosteroid isomerase-like protein